MNGHAGKNKLPGFEDVFDNSELNGGIFLFFKYGMDLIDDKLRSF